MDPLHEEILRELDRIRLRLASLNHDRLVAMDIPVYRCATAIWESTNPGGRKIPRVGPGAYAAQLTVLTQDLLAVNPHGDAEAAAALTALRRALP